MNSEELPAKEPALFALGVIVQAWFLTQKPRKRRVFLQSLKRLIALYRGGNGVSWRPEMSAEEVRSTSWQTVNWLERLAKSLDSLTR